MNFTAPYIDYLKSQHWRELRQRALDLHGPRCESCRSNKNVQVHHLIYRNLHDCTTDDLMPLCDRCHKRAHLPRIAAITKTTMNPAHRRELALQELRLALGQRKKHRTLESLLKIKARKEARKLRRNSP